MSKVSAYTASTVTSVEDNIVHWKAVEHDPGLSWDESYDKKKNAGKAPVLLLRNS